MVSVCLDREPARLQVRLPSMPNLKTPLRKFLDACPKHHQVTSSQAQLLNWSSSTVACRSGTTEEAPSQPRIAPPVKLDQQVNTLPPPLSTSSRQEDTASHMSSSLGSMLAGRRCRSFFDNCYESAGEEAAVEAQEEMFSHLGKMDLTG